MLGETFQHLKNIRDSNLAMHHLWIQGETNEAALGHIAGGKRFICQPSEPGVSTRVMLVVIPRERNQDVDIQQIRSSFLG